MSEHTDRQYEEELAELRRRLLEMGGLVERQIADAVHALVTHDTELADATIGKDRGVDKLELEIDELCLRLLALRQPAARDLRFITTALKITTDLERVGDRAATIAERAKELQAEAQLKALVDIPRMAEIASRMLRDSLDAFVHNDAELGLAVCRADDAVDQLNRQIFQELLALMAADPTVIGRAMRVLFISKYLERIADHATNIGEMVVFMVKGKSIRHASELPTSL